MIKKYNIVIYKLVSSEKDKNNKKSELKKMFPLLDIHLYLGFNFDVCN